MYIDLHCGGVVGKKKKQKNISITLRNRARMEIGSRVVCMLWIVGFIYSLCRFVILGHPFESVARVHLCHNKAPPRAGQAAKEALQALIHLIDSAGAVSQALSGRICGGVEGGLRAPGVTNGNGIAVSQVGQPQTVLWYA